MNDKMYDDMENRMNKLKEKIEYINENKEEIEKKRRETYRQTQLKSIKDTKDMIIKLRGNFTTDEIIKSSIFGIKAMNILSRLHDLNYKTETLVIMTYTQIHLAMDNKSDSKFTELLEYIYVDSLFDKSFIEKIEEFLPNDKIEKFLIGLFEYIKI